MVPKSPASNSNANQMGPHFPRTFSMRAAETLYANKLSARYVRRWGVGGREGERVQAAAHTGAPKQITYSQMILFQYRDKRRAAV